jgi:hypothetical protein
MQTRYAVAEADGLVARISNVQLCPSSLRKLCATVASVAWALPLTASPLPHVMVKRDGAMDPSCRIANGTAVIRVDKAVDACSESTRTCSDRKVASTVATRSWSAPTASSRSRTASCEATTATVRSAGQAYPPLPSFFAATTGWPAAMHNLAAASTDAAGPAKAPAAETPIRASATTPTAEIVRTRRPAIATHQLGSRTMRPPAQEWTSTRIGARAMTVGLMCRLRGPTASASCHPATETTSGANRNGAYAHPRRAAQRRLRPRPLRRLADTATQVRPVLQGASAAALLALLGMAKWPGADVRTAASVTATYTRSLSSRTYRAARQRSPTPSTTPIVSTAYTPAIRITAG